MPQGLRVQIPPSAQVSGRCALRSFSEEARLAQLVERLIDVEDVVGSSPAARTLKMVGIIKSELTNSD